MKLNTHISTLPKYWIYIVAVIVNALLTFNAIYQQPVFNIDGILYLRAAETYLNFGFQKLMHVYSEPVFCLIIAWIHKITFLSILNAAYLSTYFFTTLMVMAFIALSEELNLDEKYLWVAALVILNFQQLNVFRCLIIRDFGYWAFYLLSLLFLVKFSKTLNWKFIVGWAISIGVASLFRLEGIAFLLFAPLIIFFLPVSMKSRIYKFFQFYLVLFLFGIVLFWSFHFYRKGFFYLLYIAYLKFISQPRVLIFSFSEKIQQFSQMLFIGSHLEKPVILLIGGIVGTYFYNIFLSCNIGYWLLIIYGAVKKVLPISRHAKSVIFAYVILNFLITLVFFMNSAFLSKRYAFAMILTLLCCVPFALIDLYKKWCERSERWTLYHGLFLLVCVLMMGMAIGSIYHFGPRKQYIMNAALWFQKDTPTNITIYSNDARLLYLSNRRGNTENTQRAHRFHVAKLLTKPWKDFDYLAVVFAPKQSAAQRRVEELVGFKPIKIFHDKYMNQVLVYNISKSKDL